jgi:hypothetical protein
VNRLLLFIPILFCVSISVAKGGGSTSGDDGGQGVVCESIRPDAIRYSITVETLDLHEFSFLYESVRGHPSYYESIPALGWQPEHAERILISAKKRIQDLIGPHGILDYFDKAQNLYPIISYDPLGPTHDSGKVFLRDPGKCTVVQLGVRKGSQVFLDNDYGQMLGDRDVAAILLHETLHEYFHDHGANLVVRQAVGFIFSTREFQERNKAVFLNLINSKRAVDPKSFQ